MHKSINKQFQLFSKAFGIPSKVLRGIIIMIPLLLGTSVALNLVSKTSDDRSQATRLPALTCGWCGVSCEPIDPDKMCIQTLPPDNCSCQVTEDGSGCESLCYEIIVTPSPTSEPPQEICAVADIASMAHPEGYPNNAQSDCCVDGYDLAFLKTQFFANNSSADINKDGKVNLWDYAILVSLWLQGCVPNGEPL